MLAKASWRRGESSAAGDWASARKKSKRGAREGWKMQEKVRRLDGMLYYDELTGRFGGGIFLRSPNGRRVGLCVVQWTIAYVQGSASARQMAERVRGGNTGAVEARRGIGWARPGHWLRSGGKAPSLNRVHRRFRLLPMWSWAVQSSPFSAIWAVFFSFWILMNTCTCQIVSCSISLYPRPCLSIFVTCHDSSRYPSLASMFSKNLHQATATTS